MEIERFERMVARLEAESAAAPRRYQLKVALLALAGFGLLGLIGLGLGLGLVLLAGAVAAALWVGGAAAWLLLLKLGKLLLLAAIPVWLLLRNTMKALFVRLPAPQGRKLQRSDAPALFAALDNMRLRLRGPTVHQVLVVDGINAAIMQRPLFGLIGFPRNHLLLGLPLLESLSPDEAMAVVAHEYGHLCGAHGRFGAFIYRLRASWATIQDHAATWRGWAGRLMQRAVSAYAPYFNAYTFVLARAQEYQADATSAQLVGSAAAVAALKRTNLASAHRSGFFDQLLETTRDQATPPPDLALRWAAVATQLPAARTGPWLDRALDRSPGAMDTHPTLRQRLQALGADGAEAQAAPAPLAGPSAAQVLLGPVADTLRSEFQRSWAENAAEGWGEQHAQWQARRQRLAELEAMAERDSDQRLELLRLSMGLQPERDLREAFAEFNREHPDHALGLFLEGSARLARDDAGGLEQLEAAIRLDAEATRGACERAHAWLIERDPAAAKPWAERWQARAELEALRQQQLDRLDPKGKLLPAELAADTRVAMGKLVAQHGKGVRQAWLLRREIPADPACEAYVIVLQLGWWARLRNQGGLAVQALARQEWPMPLHLCLGHRFRAYQRTAMKIGTRLR